MNSGTTTSAANVATSAAISSPLPIIRHRKSSLSFTTPCRSFPGTLEVCISIVRFRKFIPGRPKLLIFPLDGLGRAQPMFSILFFLVGLQDLESNTIHNKDFSDPKALLLTVIFSTLSRKRVVHRSISRSSVLAVPVTTKENQ